MSLLKELFNMSEAATMDNTMAQISKACQQANVSGLSYDAAVNKITAEFRKLNKHDSSKMSDEALKDMIQAVYNFDNHLNDSDSVTNYRDVNFSLQGAGPGAHEPNSNAKGARVKEAAMPRDVASKVTQLRSSSAGIILDYNKWKRETKFKGATNYEDNGHDELAKTPEGKVVGMWDHEDNRGVANHNLHKVYEDYENDYHKLTTKFKKLVAHNKKKIQSKTLSTLKKKFEEAEVAYQEIAAQADDDGDESAVDSALESMHDVIEELKAEAMITEDTEDYRALKKRAKDAFERYRATWGIQKSVELTAKDLKISGDDVKKILRLHEDAYGDASGGPGSLDNQQQGAMPAGDPGHQPGPEGSEKVAPPPNSGTPPPPKVIAKSPNYHVQVDGDEHVKVFNSAGHLCMSLPYVEWKELTR